MDEKRIADKIDELDRYIERISSLKPATLEAYKHSLKDRMACERAMQLALEVMIDIAYILVTELKLGVPADDDAVFDKLKEKGVLSETMTITAKEMKRFRNILVHKYGEVDDEKVFENLSRLNDFEKFKEEILAFLKNTKEKTKTTARK